MSFDYRLRRLLWQSGDVNSTEPPTFTEQQEKRLKELIQEGIFRILGSRSAARHVGFGVGADYSGDKLEKALERAAEAADAIHTSDMRRLTKEVASATAKKIKRQRILAEIGKGVARVPGPGADPAYIRIWLERERDSLVDSIIQLLDEEEP